jgi:organic radical activating enzyme
MKFSPQLKLACHDKLGSYLKGNSIIPINIEISPSGICDAQCSWCFYKNEHSKQILKTEILIRFLKEAEVLGVKAITWTGGGEPTIHPDFKSIIKVPNNMEQGLITNGLKIPKYDPSVFSWIRVSKTNKDWNLNSLKVLRKCKSIGLCINYIGDDKEVKESLNIVHGLNLDYLQVRPALKLKGNKTKIWVPQIDTDDSKLIITDYKFEEASKSRIYTKCEGFHFVPFVWEDGDIDVCAYKKGNKKYNLGNIYIKKLIEMINDFPKYVNIENDCQMCCKNHEINTMIAKLREIEDVNFV